ncbi:MAG: hypothetical protein SOZ71_07320 [Clostridium sp.]|nr:hypothetical protein [Clostridium sp.]
MKRPRSNYYYENENFEKALYIMKLQLAIYITASVEEGTPIKRFGYFSPLDQAIDEVLVERLFPRFVGMMRMQLDKYPDSGSMELGKINGVPALRINDLVFMGYKSAMHKEWAKNQQYLLKNIDRGHNVHHHTKEDAGRKLIDMISFLYSHPSKEFVDKYYNLETRLVYFYDKPLKNIEKIFEPFSRHNPKHMVFEWENLEENGIRLKINLLNNFKDIKESFLRFYKQNYPEGNNLREAELNIVLTKNCRVGKIEIDLTDEHFQTYKLENIEEHLEICDKVYIYNQMEEYVNEVNSLVEDEKYRDIVGKQDLRMFNVDNRTIDQFLTRYWELKSKVSEISREMPFTKEENKMIFEHIENEKLLEAVSYAIYFIDKATRDCFNFYGGNANVKTLLTKEELVDNIVMLTGGFNSEFARLVRMNSDYDFLMCKEIDKAIKEKLSSFNKPIRVRDVVEAVRNVEKIEMRLGFKPRDVLNLINEINKKEYNHKLEYNVLYDGFIKARQPRSYENITIEKSQSGKGYVMSKTFNSVKKDKTKKVQKTTIEREG